MTTRTYAVFGLSALMLGGTMVGCGMKTGGIASAGSVAQGHASAEADAARALLAKRKPAAAIAHAESAVAASPAEPVYRALLGQSYLSVGRFASARQAFADALALDSTDMRFALSLALAQTASGDWTGARHTLDTHPAIPAADRGLAIALAGDPAAAIAILLPAARQPGATPKTRQNLALAFALGGKWNEARALAALDVAPDKLDQRMTEWAAFVRPERKSDQVAALLGVKPAADPGFPIALALNAAVSPTQPAQVAVQSQALPVQAVTPIVLPAKVAAPTPVAAPIATSTPIAVAAAAPSEPVATPAAMPVEPASPATLIAAPRGRSRVAIVPVAAPRRAAAGGYVIQLGAFGSSQVAREAWSKIQRRNVAFADRIPQGNAIALRGRQFYRLSVGGYARTDADRLCRQYRVKGGQCFVRAAAGDAMAAWLRPSGVKLASR